MRSHDTSLHCQVQSTAKYKEVLLDQPVAVTPLFGGVLLPAVIKGSWQFSTLEPLGDELVAASHDNTVLVLEPKSLSCVGGMSLGQSIVDMSTDGRSIYLLCRGHQRAVVKLSLPVEEKPGSLDDLQQLGAVQKEEEEEVGERNEEDSPVKDVPLLVVTEPLVEETEPSVPLHDEEETDSGVVEEGVTIEPSGIPLVDEQESVPTDNTASGLIEETITKKHEEEEGEGGMRRDVQPASNPSFLKKALAIEQMLGQQVTEIKSKLSIVSELTEQLIKPHQSHQPEPTPGVPDPVLVSIHKSVCLSVCLSACLMYRALSHPACH